MSPREMEEVVVSESYKADSWAALVAIMRAGLRWAVRKAYAQGYAAGSRDRAKSAREADSRAI